MNFYVGIFDPSTAWPFERCMISVNAVRDRKRDFRVNEWMLDSAAFTEITTHGGYRHGVEEYAEHINRWKSVGKMVSASTQDYMCEPFVLEITGKTVSEHQELTIDRYSKLRSIVDDVYILPVLQGYDVSDYARHTEQYGKLLDHGAWVGVGSVCKRNANPDTVEDILRAILSVRPDLKLHGFGLKIESLKNPAVKDMLYSSDSMAWSFQARREGNDGNDPRNALSYCARVQNILQENQFYQPILLEWWKQNVN